MIKERAKIHIHSEYSINDALSIEKTIQKAKEYGATCIALTDHGTLTGIPSFMDLCKKYEIKGIPGLEAYLQEDDDILQKRLHVLFLAKNITGYQQISKLSTASYARMKNGFPVINKEMIKKIFTTGDVICSSACIQGILCMPLLYNHEVDNKIQKIRESINKACKNKTAQILKDKEEFASLLPKIEELSKNTDSLKLQMKEKKKNKEDFSEIEKKLEENKKESAVLKERKNVLGKNKDLYTKISTLEAQIRKLEESKKTEEEMREAAIQEAKWYQEQFGYNFFIELQYHGMPEEAYAMPILAEIAEELHIPVILTNDAHYAEKEDAFARRLLRMADFDKWIDGGETDEQLYLKSDQEMIETLSKILKPETIEKGLKNLDFIEKKCNVEFTKESHYPKYPCPAGKTAEDILRGKTMAGIKAKYENITPEIKSRVEKELSVISKMGYADYHLIVADFLEYGRLLGLLPVSEIADAPLSKKALEDEIAEKGYDIGLSIGPGRGSAVGSIVCYALGITNLDPLNLGLLFERFLNIERVSMPDIDSDFSPDVRDKVIEYVKSKYGEKSVCCITTINTRAAKAAIRAFASIRACKNIGDKSVDAAKRQWSSYADVICKLVPNTPEIKLDDCDFTSLEATGNWKIYKEIISGAKLLEGSFSSYSMHAAGVIIADNHNVADYIPLMWNNSTQQWACQCNMVQAEDAGLLKMDFLGLKNLKIISDTIKSVKEQTGIKIDTDQIPFEPDVFRNIYAKGETNFIFQFESDGMKDLCRKLMPECFEDIILANAAYRPGPMQYLPKIIEAKASKKQEYLIPELEPILKSTYGSIIYQEQVMEIFQKLAGYSLGQADMVRRAMSKKKEKVLLKERDAFINGDEARKITGCVKNGIPEDKGNILFDQMTEFAKYAFNKSHAAAYARVSYLTAWLKFHYPKHYLCAVMNMSKIEKMSKLVAECKKYGITLTPPDINRSEEFFKADPVEEKIYYSFAKIKNIGSAALSLVEKREEKYASFKDFIMKSKANKKVAEALIYAGALDQFSKSRTAMINAYAEIKGLYDNYDKALRSKQEATTLLEHFSSSYFEAHKEKFSEIKELPAKRVTLENRLKKAKEDLRIYLDAIVNAKVYDKVPDNFKDRMAKELEMLGAYVSAHPMDHYSDPADYGCVSIKNLQADENVSVIGVIKDFREVKRKSDNAPMYFFTIEDKEESLRVCCFTKQTVHNRDTLSEITDGDIVKIYGKLNVEVEEIGEEIHIEKKFFMEEISKIKEEKEKYILSLNKKDDLTSLKPTILKYVEEEGHPLLVFDKTSKKLFSVPSVKVSDDFIDNIYGLEVCVR